VINIHEGGLEDEQVVDLLTYHFKKCHEVTPVGSAHVFDVTKLQDSSVHFYSAWLDGSVLGVGAFKVIEPQHGEIKSMHTSEDARRKGVGGALVEHIIREARGFGLKRLSLETGSFDFFKPAVALYVKHGFKLCGPIRGYTADPNSVFLTREI
jgi:putative acetyltransferase